MRHLTTIVGRAGAGRAGSAILLFVALFVATGCDTGGMTEDGCGDGVVIIPERCDDGNTDNGDGCSEACNIEIGYNCSGSPSVCRMGLPDPVCLDRMVGEGEECDDGMETGSCDPDCTFPRSVSEMVTGAVLPGAAFTHTFAASADLSALGAHAIQGRVTIAMDSVAANDLLTLPFRVDDTPFYPAGATYSEGFESSAGGGIATGSSSTWALGSPTAHVHRLGRHGRQRMGHPPRLRLRQQRGLAGHIRLFSTSRPWPPIPR